MRLGKLLLGAAGAGKQSLLFRLSRDEFKGEISKEERRNRCEIQSSKISTDWEQLGWRKSMELEIVDEISETLLVMPVEAVAIVVNMVERETYEAIGKWKVEALKLTMRSRRAVPIVVVATCCDLTLFSPEAQTESMQQQCKYYELSSKTGEGVKEAFQSILGLVAGAGMTRKARRTLAEGPSLFKTVERALAATTMEDEEFNASSSSQKEVDKSHRAQKSGESRHAGLKLGFDFESPEPVSAKHVQPSRAEQYASSQATRRSLLMLSSEELRSRHHVVKQASNSAESTDQVRSSRTSANLSTPEAERRSLKLSKSQTTSGRTIPLDAATKVPTQIDFQKEIDFDEHKRLAIMSGTDLFLYKVSHNKKKLDHIIDITMATVTRPNARSLKLVLVLSSGDQHRLRFHDEGALALFKGHIQARVKAKGPASARATVVLAPKSHSVIVAGEDALALLRTSEDNQYCAECTKEAPEYAATNLGIVICEECALAHQQLSSATSRVLSILDESWNPYILELMMSISNAQSNTVWEHRLIEDEAICLRAGLPNRPSPDSSFNDKFAFVEAKYAKRAFLDPHYLGSLLNMDDERPHMAMNFAIRLSVARLDLILALVKFIAHEISPDYVIDSQALIVIACLNGNYLALSLLLENGANPNVKDSLGSIPLDYASKLNAKSDEIIKNEAIVPPELFYASSVGHVDAKRQIPNQESSPRASMYPTGLHNPALPSYNSSKSLTETIDSEISSPDDGKDDVFEESNTSAEQRSHFSEKKKNKKMQIDNKEEGRGKAPSDPERLTENDENGKSTISSAVDDAKMKKRLHKRSNSSGGSLGGESKPDVDKVMASTAEMEQKMKLKSEQRKASKEIVRRKQSEIKVELKDDKNEKSLGESDAPPAEAEMAQVLEWPLASTLLLDYGATPRSYSVPGPKIEDDKMSSGRLSLNRGKAAKLLGLMDALENAPSAPISSSSPRSSYIAPRSPGSSSPRDSTTFVPLSPSGSASSTLILTKSSSGITNVSPTAPMHTPKSLRKSNARKTMAYTSDLSRTLQLGDFERAREAQNFSSTQVAYSPNSASSKDSSPTSSSVASPSSSVSDLGMSSDSTLASPRSPLNSSALLATPPYGMLHSQPLLTSDANAPSSDALPVQRQTSWRSAAKGSQEINLPRLAAPSAENVRSNEAQAAYEHPQASTWSPRKYKEEQGGQTQAHSPRIAEVRMSASIGGSKSANSQD